MNELLLDSLDIQGFRAFDHLRIERLGRVNLIVGRNNVGKTSLLEALWMYAEQGNPGSLFEMLALRDEVNRSELQRSDYSAIAISTLRALFHGRQAIGLRTVACQIGPASDPKRLLKLAIEIGWSEPGKKSGGDAQGHQLPDRGAFKEPGLAYVVREGGDATRVILLEGIGDRLTRSVRWDVMPSVFVSANSLTRQQINRLWDKVALTQLEDAVLESLHIIAPDVARLNLVSYGESGDNDSMHRIPVVRLENLDDPILLRSLGEGMNRLFGISLSLVNAKDGFLLVDEIESGIHHSVQPDLWRLIFTMARRLNVQVFATTHSRDCIEAFQIAAAENADEDGMLIRLEREGESIVPTLFDSRRLAIATREQIEVR